ncbi:glycosyltransferase family 4 protein [Haloarcula marismortui]|uniref:glycosyltransferase family 4 protein n=1 Tax=Haloarcula marismortui TaxID=2238 RepID=UPI003C786CD9
MSKRTDGEEKVAIFGVLPPGNDGGYERFLLDLRETLKEEGYTVDIYSAREQPVANLSKLEKALYDITLLSKVLIYGLYLTLFGSGYQAIITSDFVGLTVWTPRVNRLHLYTGTALADEMGNDISARTMVLKILYWLSGQGKHVVVKSQHVSTALEDLYGFKPTVLPNPIDTDHFKKRESVDFAELPEDIDKPVGLYVGRWDDEVKGTDTLREMIGQNEQLHWLLVVGGGQEPHGLEDLSGYTLMRNVPQEVIPQVYSISDFTIIPSRTEGFSYVAVESLACETPVIACSERIPSIKPIYESEDFNPLCVSSPNSISEFEESINWVINNPDQSEFLGKRAQQEVADRYSFDQWQQRLNRLIEGNQEHRTV